MQEQILTATDTMDHVVSDIQAAMKIANAIERPEGRTLADKATSAYLAECLAIATQLRERLAMIA